MKRKFINLIITLIFLCGTAVYAQESYADVPVKVYQYVNGAEDVIYAGTLGGYDNGKWSGIDVTEMNMLTIVKWNGNGFDENFNPIYIQAISQNIETKTLNEQRMTGNLNRNSADFDITSQIKLNNINVGEDGLRIINGGALNGHFSITNNSGKTRKVSLLMATYIHDGELYNVESKSVNIAPQSMADIDLQYNFDTAYESTAKLMMWEDLNGMIPVRTSIDFDQNSGINAYYYDADNRLLQADKMNGTSVIYTYDKTGNMLTTSVRQ